MIDLRSQKSYDCNDLRKIVHILRSPGGCQWDQAQTHQSIRRNFLEEAYEVAEAIDEGDLDHLKEELGDVLLQVVFHSSIEEDAGRFDLDDPHDRILAVDVTCEGETLELEIIQNGETIYTEPISGADGVQYFQWRKGRGGSEQFHGAVVDHDGRDDTRVFNEVTTTNEALAALTPVCGSLPKADAAMIFDWDNRWALDDAWGMQIKQKNLRETCCQLYAQLNHCGVETTTAIRAGGRMVSSQVGRNLSEAP